MTSRLSKEEILWARFSPVTLSSLLKPLLQAAEVRSLSETMAPRT